MQYEVNTVQEYIAALPEDRKPVIEKLRQVILANLPDGFEEQISSGMIGYVVPLSRYPKGYHVKKDEPLPFLALASQKNHVAVYHMGLYGNPALEAWFIKEYAERVSTKLDMGKSCIRFKNPDQIPYDLVAELCQKITVDEYINSYERAVKRS
ncbi:MAG: DUF1801 domain-containing protein [Brevefilum sp.]|nr:DUF1801 domain-containing protein [Brevefilum sp.]